MGGADAVVDKARASAEGGDLRWAAQVLDHVVFAIQVNGPEAWNLDLAVRWEFPDHRATYRTTLHNGVFSYTRDGQGDVALTLKVPRPALGALAAGDVGQAQGAGLTLDGDPAVLKQILGVLQPGDPAFNIIEP
jgi:alkyl sulfatase BDS1-like metallo-beta-lactamase superfamily hydrolase